jgi:hypothetical protein
MTWLTGIIGQGIASNLGGAAHNRQQHAAQATQYGLTGCQSSAQAQAMAAQQAYAYGAQQMAAGHTQQWRPPQWMFNGKTMEFKEFVDTMFPEDTAEKTAFVLKWSNNETS